MRRYLTTVHMILSPDTDHGRVRRIVILCCLANLINAADRVIMPIAIIPLADHYKWDMHKNGLVLSAFSVGYMGSMILGGSAAKRYGCAYTLMLAVLLWSLSSLVTPWFAFSSNALVFLRFLLGVGEGIGLPTTVHLFSQLVPLEQRSRALGYLIGFGSVGQIVATLICPHLAWQWCFYLFGSLGILWFVGWCSVLSDVRRTDRLNEDIFLQQPQTLYQSPRWYEFISHWPLWAIYWAHFSMNWSSYIVMQWLPTYLFRVLEASNYQIMYTALPYLSNCAASIIAGHLADSLIRRQWTVLSVRRLMSSIGLFGPAMLLFWLSEISSISGAIFIVSLTMALSAFNSAGHLSNHGEIAPKYTGITFAISSTLATIPGVLCGPMTAELVVSSGGRWFPVFFLAGCINLLGAVIYISQSSSTQVL